MKELTQSLEKYLTAIHKIVEKNTAARVKDVAKEMNIGIASTSEAVKALAKKGFIHYVPYGIITITEKGNLAICKKSERHEIICNFLSKCLMMDNTTVEKSANNIEFSMTEDVLERFVEYLSFMQKCSCKEPKWIKSFQHYIENGKMQKKCEFCMKNKEKFDNSSCCGCGK